MTHPKTILLSLALGLLVTTAQAQGRWSLSPQAAIGLTKQPGRLQVASGGSVSQFPPYEYPRNGLSYNVGLNAFRRLSARLWFGTGLGLGRKSYKDYQLFIVDRKGNVLPALDTVRQTVRFLDLQLPVLFQIRSGTNPGWKFVCTFGGILGMSLSYVDRFESLYSTHNDYTIRRNLSAQWPNHFSLRLGLGVCRRFHEKCSLLVEPVYERDFTQLARPASGVDPRHTTRAFYLTTMLVYALD